MAATLNNTNKRAPTNCMPSRRGALMMAVATALIFFVGATAPAVVAQGSEPVIDEFEPARGTAGTSIDIRGEGFLDDSVVRFGGIEVDATLNGDDHLVIEAMDLAEGSYSIEVENAAGASTICCFELNGGTAAADEDDTSSEPATDDASCKDPNMNIECTEMGRIAMESQRDIRGEYIDVSIDVTLDTAYADRDARWVLFSIRNVTADGSNPVRIDLERFYTQHGDVVTNNIEDTQPNEVNIWVHVLDIPVDEKITIDTSIGVVDRGAYRLETLVMVFDRGYAPIIDDSGNDAKLFSFTLLGVNEETGSGGFGSNDVSNRLQSLPAAPIWSVLAVLGAVAVAVSRRTRS